MKSFSLVLKDWEGQTELAQDLNRNLVLINDALRREQNLFLNINLADLDFFDLVVGIPLLIVGLLVLREIYHVRKRLDRLEQKISHDPQKEK